MPTAQQDGSICAPFKTISQGLAIAAARPIGSGLDIEVQPGQYDEDLTIPGQRSVAIRSLGIELGTSGTPRSVTWTDGPMPGRFLLEMVHVTGDLVVAGVGGVSGSDLLVVGPQDVDGALDASAYAGILAIECSASFSPGSGNFGSVNAPTAELTTVERNNFFGTVVIGSYGRIVGAEFDDDVTVNIGPSPTEPSAGFYRSFFLGQHTYSSPGELRLDGVSNFSFKASGWALAGGATKVIIEDLVP